MIVHILGMSLCFRERLMKMNLPNGTDTGLRDSNGVTIHVGDYVQRQVTGNVEIHGEWTIQLVETRGIVPILSYVKSEKGPILPEGYTAGLLSHLYDQDMLVFINDVTTLRPSEEEIFVLTEERKKELN